MKLAFGYQFSFQLSAFSQYSEPSLSSQVEFSTVTTDLKLDFGYQLSFWLISYQWTRSDHHAEFCIEINFLQLQAAIKLNQLKL